MTVPDAASPDLITVGRVTMDLLSQDIGAPFEDVTGFATSVGGSPTNIAIASARLGLRPLAFTGVGDDLVGDYVLRYLGDEGVDTSHVARVAGKRTSLAMVAIQPPDRFPLSFYREDPADIYLTVDDAAALPVARATALLLSGNAFGRGTCADAARACAEQASGAQTTTYMDLDLRPTEWAEPRDYGVAIRDVLPLVDVLIGTEEECFAALSPTPEAVIAGAALGDAEHTAVDEQLERLVADGVLAAVVIKRGPRGATVISAGGRTDVDGFEVEAVNTVGAGDAFAAGLIRSRGAGLDWRRSARFGAACGAIQVTRHGCSAVFPRTAEVDAFIDEHGGL